MLPAPMTPSRLAEEATGAVSTGRAEPIKTLRPALLTTIRAPRGMPASVSIEGSRGEADSSRPRPAPPGQIEPEAGLQRGDLGAESREYLS